MKEMEFKEFVEKKIRDFEIYHGPADLDGEIDQFGAFTITVHGKKETLVYTAEDMEAYYMSYLNERAGAYGERVEAVY